VAKNKGKRNRSQRSTVPTPSSAQTAEAVSAKPEAHAHEAEGHESLPAGGRSTLSIDPTPSSDNVIPFPRSAAMVAEARDTKATLISGTDSFTAPKVPAEETAKPAPETAKPSENSALHPPPGEQERSTIPPDEATGERARLVTPESPVLPEKTAEKTTEKPLKPSEDETRKTLRGEVVGKKDDTRRSHKESLSTHLSDEARAFFSEAAAAAAYKHTHDTFEDLAPASEEHAAEVARSRRAMTITGVLLVGVIAVVAGFGIYSRTSVPETGLDRSPAAVEAPPSAATSPTPAAEPATPPPAAEPTPPPAAEPTAAPVAAATPAAEPTPAPTAAPAVEPTPAPAAAPTPVAAATPEPAPAPAPAPAPTPPAPVAAPTGQTPQQLLAAARSFRGPFAGKLAAYNAYFDANPTDDRTMTTYAMSLAESAHNAEAEAVANRAVTANPRSGQAWFVLAYARSQQRNRAGAAEARTRCIALGGTWANECRAIR
jgi:hypothetical protein